MKKRVFVCMLILITCLFQVAMPIKVSAEGTSLAQQVFDAHIAFLLRSDIQEALLDTFTLLKDPAIQQLLTPDTINLFIQDPDALKPIVSGLSDDFITLLKDDTAIKAFFSDDNVQALLVAPEAIDALIVLIHETQVIETRRTFDLRLAGTC